MGFNSGFKGLTDCLVYFSVSSIKIGPDSAQSVQWLI